MNVRANESMGETWAMLEGSVVNGMFPLRTFLGGSDHSAVFFAHVAGRDPSDVAIKLVPVTPLADAQLSRWLVASCFDHPNLLNLFDAGRCQLDGRHFLYAVMEHADQNLGQLLERRALSEDETREMLVPTLKALAFIHSQNFAHGQVKPSNILVVGDRLKLAAETIRPIGEARESTHAISGYDPPEARTSSYSTAADIWALGVSLCEALTQEGPVRDLSGMVLPVTMPAAFRGLVARCLCIEPADRLTVSDVEAWLRGEPLPALPVADLQAEMILTSTGANLAPLPSQAWIAPPPSAASAPMSVQLPADSAGVVTTGTYRAMPAAARAATGTHKAMPEAAGAATGTHKVTPEAARAATGTHKAMPEAARAATGTHKVMPEAARAALPRAVPTPARAPASAAASGPLADATAPRERRAAPTQPPAAAPSAQAVSNAGQRVTPPGAATRPATVPVVPQAQPAALTRPASGQMAAQASAAGMAKSAPATASPAAAARPAPATAAAPSAKRGPDAAAASATSSTITVSTLPAPSVEEMLTKPATTFERPKIASISLLLAAFVLFVLAWAGMRSLRTSRTEEPPAPPVAAAPTPDESVAELPQEVVVAQPAPDPEPAAAVPPAGSVEPSARPAAKPPTQTARATALASAIHDALAEMPAGPLATHEEIPTVPSGASRTIRGKVRVAVRVIVNSDGSVFAALADQRGPSRYFERLSIDAAKKWTFTPSESDKQRLMLVRFSFTRNGTTADAVAVK